MYYSLPRYMYRGTAAAPCACLACQGLAWCSVRRRTTCWVRVRGGAGRARQQAPGSGSERPEGESYMWRHFRGGVRPARSRACRQAGRYLCTSSSKCSRVVTNQVVYKCEARSQGSQRLPALPYSTARMTTCQRQSRQDTYLGARKRSSPETQQQAQHVGM